MLGEFIRRIQQGPSLKGCSGALGESGYRKERKVNTNDSRPTRKSLLKGNSINEAYEFMVFALKS